MSHEVPVNPLCALDDIPDGQAIAVECELDGAPASLIVWRQGGAVSVFHNICPHAGRRLDWAPGRFLVKDAVLVCAAHGASFAAETGTCIGGPCRGDRLRRVPARVEDGHVVLERPPAPVA